MEGSGYERSSMIGRQVWRLMEPWQRMKILMSSEGRGYGGGLQTKLMRTNTFSHVHINVLFVSGRYFCSKHNI